MCVLGKRDLTSSRKLKGCDWSISRRCPASVTSHVSQWKLLDHLSQENSVREVSCYLNIAFIVF